MFRLEAFGAMVGFLMSDVFSDLFNVGPRNGEGAVS
jgi:hypothetical protein